MRLALPLGGTMITRIKRYWKDIRGGKPGRRFQDHYERTHQDGGHPARRVAIFGLGGALVAAGVFFLAVPGPGTLIILLGAGLLAQESMHAARALDWSELHVRKLYRWARSIWARLPLWAKVIAVIVKIAIAAGLGYLAYRILFS